jgi:hypothetical protein
MPLLLYPWYPMDRRLGGSQSQSGRGEEKILDPIKTRTPTPRFSSRQPVASEKLRETVVVRKYDGAGENPSFCMTFHIYNIKKLIAPMVFIAIMKFLLLATLALLQFHFVSIFTSSLLELNHI